MILGQRLPPTSRDMDRTHKDSSFLEQIWQYLNGHGNRQELRDGEYDHRRRREQIGVVMVKEFRGFIITKKLCFGER